MAKVKSMNGQVMFYLDIMSTSAGEENEEDEEGSLLSFFFIRVSPPPSEVNRKTRSQSRFFPTPITPPILVRRVLGPI